MEKITLRQIGLKKLIIILACGIALIVLSFSEMFSQNSKSKNNSAIEKNSSNEDAKETETKYIESVEERLRKMLRKVEGIGDVEVMITLKESSEDVVLKDNPYSKEEQQDSNFYSEEETTILMESKEGDTYPYVVKEVQPKVEGVLILAKGADNLEIINEINEAVQVLFDIPVHKIKVMKMNDSKEVE